MPETGNVPEIGSVPEVCTCGAQLPPDARFCHKCGKPQRDEPLIPQEPMEAVVEERTAGGFGAPPPLAPAPLQPRIGFHNGSAVRAALLAGGGAFVASLVAGQLVPQLFPIFSSLGGFFAVYLYKKRTGYRLSVISGAHLGWLSGIFVFVVLTMIIAGTALMLSDPSILSMMREQAQTKGMPNAAFEQAVTMLRTPSGVTSALAVSFVTFTILPAFGGAIGARLLGRD